MVRMLISLIVASFCLYYGILYENTIMITLAFALLLLLGFSVLEVFYRKFTTKCHLEIPVGMVDTNKPVPLVFRISNKSLFSSGRMDIKVGIHSSLATKSTTQWLSIPQVSAGTNNYEFGVIINGAGRHEIEVTKLRFYSTFGLFSIKKKCKENGMILILPEMHSIVMETTEGTRNFLGDADVYDEFRPGHDSGETFEIREYREKDKLQSIHWKLSAKIEDLVVRENSLPKACAIVLLLDMKEMKAKNVEEYASGYLEIAASISFGLMDRKIPHFVAWMSKLTGDIRRIRVDDEESFYLFMVHYLNDGAIQNEKDIREEYREKFKNELYRKDICVNNHLEIYQDGQLLEKIDVKKIKDECEQLELLL